MPCLVAIADCTHAHTIVHHNMPCLVAIADCTHAHTIVHHNMPCLVAIADCAHAHTIVHHNMPRLVAIADYTHAHNIVHNMPCLVAIADCTHAHIVHHNMPCLVAIADCTHAHTIVHHNMPCLVAIADCPHVGSATASINDFVSIAQENPANKTATVHPSPCMYDPSTFHAYHNLTYNRSIRYNLPTSRLEIFDLKYSNSLRRLTCFQITPKNAMVHRGIANDTIKPAYIRVVLYYRNELHLKYRLSRQHVQYYTQNNHSYSVLLWLVELLLLGHCYQVVIRASVKHQPFGWWSSPVQLLPSSQRRLHRTPHEYSKQQQQDTVCVCFIYKERQLTTNTLWLVRRRIRSIPHHKLKGHQTGCG